jgi:hypothetical protein
MVVESCGALAVPPVDAHPTEAAIVTTQAIGMRMAR